MMQSVWHVVNAINAQSDNKISSWLWGTACNSRELSKEIKWMFCMLCWGNWWNLRLDTQTYRSQLCTCRMQLWQIFLLTQTQVWFELPSSLWFTRKTLVVLIMYPGSASDCLALERMSLLTRLEGGLLAPGMRLFGDNALRNLMLMAKPYSTVFGSSRDAYNLISHRFHLPPHLAHFSHTFKWFEEGWTKSIPEHALLSVVWLCISAVTLLWAHLIGFEQSSWHSDIGTTGLISLLFHLSANSWNTVGGVTVKFNASSTWQILATACQGKADLTSSWVRHMNEDRMHGRRSLQCPPAWLALSYCSYWALEMIFFTLVPCLLLYAQTLSSISASVGPFFKICSLLFIVMAGW